MTNGIKTNLVTVMWLGGTAARPLMRMSEILVGRLPHIMWLDWISMCCMGVS